MRAFIDRIPPDVRTIIRVVAGLCGFLGLGFVTLVLLFFGSIAASGCFIECTEPNPAASVVLLTSAAVTGALSVGSLVFAIVGRDWRRLRIGLLAGGGLAVLLAVVTAVLLS